MTPAQRAEAHPDSIHQLKVTLRMVRPPIWRRLQVPSETTLDRRHQILQTAMGWEDAHLHSFRVDDTTYSDPELMGDMGDRSERTARLDQVAPRKGSALNYEGDFGDGWDHKCKVEAVRAPEPGVSVPVCVAGERACPPEDCGGPWGYEALLEALDDPSNPEHADLLEWLGGPFDPEAFDLEGTNRRLAEVR